MLNPRDHVVKRPCSEYFYADFYTSPKEGGKAKRIYRSLKTKNRIEAIQACSRIIEKYHSESKEAIESAETLTLLKLFDKYIETKRANSVNTIEAYVTSKRSAEKYFGSDFLVKDVDVSKMAAYHEWIAKQNKAPDTIRMYLNAVKIIFSWAWQSGIIKTNPLKLFKLPKGSGHRLEWFTPEQLEKILTLVEEPNYGLVLTLANTGARKMSVVKMEWEWIDLEKKVITFPARVIKTGIVVRVPVSDTLFEYLTQKRKAMPEEAKFVFSRDDGKTHVGGLRFQYNRILKHLGLKGNVHSLRHSFATNYLDHNPGDIKGLSQILGCTDPKMAMKYAHITSKLFEEQRAAINQMYRVQKPGPRVGNTSSTTVSSIGESSTGNVTRLVPGIAKHSDLVASQGGRE